MRKILFMSCAVLASAVVSYFLQSIFRVNSDISAALIFIFIIMPTFIYIIISSGEVEDHEDKM